MRRSEPRQRGESLFGTERESLFAQIMLADIERQAGNLDRRARAAR